MHSRVSQLTPPCSTPQHPKPASHNRATPTLFYHSYLPGQFKPCWNLTTDICPPTQPSSLVSSTLIYVHIHMICRESLFPPCLPPIPHFPSPPLSNESCHGGQILFLLPLLKPFTSWSCFILIIPAASPRFSSDGLEAADVLTCVCVFEQKRLTNYKVHVHLAPRNPDAESSFYMV